ncbi:MAG: helix-turn-helix transcriptional regulator [Pseudomonadota bacterium]
MLYLVMADYPQKNALHPVFIGEWRKQKNMTAQQLADVAGMTRSLISQLESGSKRVNIDHLLKISAALDLHHADLLRSPQDRFNDLSKIYETIPDDQKDKALKLLSTFSEDDAKGT